MNCSSEIDSDCLQHNIDVRAAWSSSVLCWCCVIIIVSMLLSNIKAGFNMFNIGIGMCCIYSTIKAISYTIEGSGTKDCETSTKCENNSENKEEPTPEAASENKEEPTPEAAPEKTVIKCFKVNKLDDGTYTYGNLKYENKEFYSLDKETYNTKKECESDLKSVKKWTSLKETINILHTDAKKSLNDEQYKIFIKYFDYDRMYKIFNKLLYNDNLNFETEFQTKKFDEEINKVVATIKKYSKKEDEEKTISPAKPNTKTVENFAPFIPI